MIKTKKNIEQPAVERCEVDYKTGLTAEQAEHRKSAGLSNAQTITTTKTIAQIVTKNSFTLFNLINLVLAIIIVMFSQWKNALFIGVALINTAMGIFQEIRAKKTIDKLAVVVQEKVSVVRDGQSIFLPPTEIVLDDIVFVEAGNQICNDGTIVNTSFIEVDESLLTGESDQISKVAGDQVMSGSFVTSGSAYIRVEAVGKDNYATKLTVEAKREKKKTSQLMRTINNIIRVLTAVIVPIGLLLFYSQYNKGIGFEAAVLGSTAAILGMIPEGLMLLTSIAFAAGAVNLAKHKTLVQSLPSIETLARADVLCLDKTGTITDGNLTVKEIIKTGHQEGDLSEVLFCVINSVNDQNPTAKAIKKACTKRCDWSATSVIPFSSRRKWSGASFGERGSYIIGAPDFMFTELASETREIVALNMESGFRVLAIGHSQSMLEHADLPEDLVCVGLVVLSDNIRPNAVKTFEFFTQQGIALKVISGDNPATVSRIAKLAEIPNSDKYIDMSSLDEGEDLTQIVEQNTVFGRVSPYQKRELVKALHQNKKTVCMTGDGVNDLLALREADCSIAIANGSAAARSIANFVLLDSNFGALVEVFKEGCRIINNIEHVASLYLIKTIYSVLLAILFIYLPFTYPFSPLQMSPINTLTVGIPSFFLALAADYKKPEGRFAANVLENSLPAALTIIFNILILQLIGLSFALPQGEIATMSILLVGVCGFVVLYKISKPLNVPRMILLSVLMVGFCSCFIFLNDFFEFKGLFGRNAFFYVPLIIFSKNIFYKLNHIVVLLEQRVSRWLVKRASGY